MLIPPGCIPLKPCLVQHKSVNFQTDDDQEVEVSTHVDEESLVVMSDSSQNKKRRFVGKWVGHRAFQEETKNDILWHDPKQNTNITVFCQTD